jgi:hypothetical protein
MLSRGKKQIALISTVFPTGWSPWVPGGALLNRQKWQRHVVEDSTVVQSGGSVPLLPTCLIGVVISGRDSHHRVPAHRRDSR